MQQGKYHKFEPVKRFDEYSKKYSNDLLIKALIDPFKKAKQSQGKTRYYSNSGKLLLVPYTKDFGIITRF